jgi:hypothetical protein
LCPQLFLLLGEGDYAFFRKFVVKRNLLMYEKEYRVFGAAELERAA